jgi:hypothetical protein
MRASDFLASAQAEVAPPADSTVCANLYPEPGGLLRLPRWAVLSIVTLAALLLCAVATAAVRPNTPRGAAVGYTCDSLTLLTCAAAFWIHRRSATGLLRIRWSIMVAALLAASAAFAECFPDAFGVSSPLLRPFQVILFNIGDALYILAAVLFFSGVARSIVVLDMFQGLLLVVLRYNLTYTRTNSDHFTVNHLLISQMVALFLFLIVLIAGFGAASASEHRFLRFLSWFFGLRFVSWFLSDQVSYTWLHNRYCSLWDAPGPALLIGFALYLIYTAPSPQAAHNVEDTHVRRPSLFVRSLMPSFLALANLVLALFLLRLSMPTAAFAILLTVGLYVARTALLQSHAAQQSALLQSRNEQLEGLATRDPLTGIGNRRSLAAVYAAQQATTGGSGLALLLMISTTSSRLTTSWGTSMVTKSSSLWPGRLKALPLACRAATAPVSAATSSLCCFLLPPRMTHARWPKRFAPTSPL